MRLKKKLPSVANFPGVHECKVRWGNLEHFFSFLIALCFATNLLSSLKTCEVQALYLRPENMVTKMAS